ncbi:MAG: RNase adapter RapZ [Azospirillaceae bacterium]
MIAKPPANQSTDPAADPAAASPDRGEESVDSPIVVVTGMSGAGLSTTLKILEDLGYEAVDNLPLGLVPELIRQRQGERRPLALTVDIRTRDFSPESLARVFQAIGPDRMGSLRTIFLEADLDVLQRRYTETRRRHHLALDRPVVDGLRLEQRLVEPLRQVASLVLDTSQLSQHELKRRISEEFAVGASGLFVSVMSFSFKRGLPREADLVVDVRFLDNPHWVEELRPLTGNDEAVKAHIRADPDFQPFLDNLQRLLTPLLPRYVREGKSYLTIAAGCTGGRHRSVFTAAALADWLAGTGHRVGLTHRDLPPEEAVTATPAGERGNP